MKNFFKSLCHGTLNVLKGAIANPKTTIAGLTLIASAVLPQYTGEIATAGGIATKVLIGSGLVLAKDSTTTGAPQ